jgi:Protein of unknown function (DUF3011)
MNLRNLLLGTLVLLGATAMNLARADDGRYDHGYGGGARGQFAIPCGSSDGAPRHCAVDLRGLRFLDFQQQSRADCRPGDTFGFDGRGIWVTRGCRAQFLFVEESGRGRDWRDDDDRDHRWQRGVTSLVCASQDGRRSWCPLPRGSDVQLRRQLSRATCVRGHTWDASRSGLWVDRGCRAEFEVSRRRG